MHQGITNSENNFQEPVKGKDEVDFEIWNENLSQGIHENT